MDNILNENNDYNNEEMLISAEDADHKEEQLHWHNVQRTMLLYEEFCRAALERRQQRIAQLPMAKRARLPQLSFNKFNTYHEACSCNQIFFEELVRYTCESNCKIFSSIL